MIISLWRYSHLLLAISSAIFLLIASVTGIILALEPMSDVIKPYAIDNIEDITISETITALQKEYDEIIEITVEENDFVIASVVTKEGNDERIYVNPRTGEKLGVPERKSGVFKFATNLHRSLFLKGIGRFFVGLISLLLIFIVITGILLIGKRQGGILKFFSKVNKEYVNQFYHVVIGRWFFVPIIIIAFTGVYLSLEKFALLPKYEVPHRISAQTEQKKETIASISFPIFKKITLTNVKSIEFPFSDDVEDYFTLELINKELIVHQFSGNILSEQQYPFVKLVSYYSLLLHTGKGNVFWSVVLLVTCVAILFFMYSGFYMTVQRRKGSNLIYNIEDKDASEYIILVGSENGSTYTFANYLRSALLSVGKTVFVAELNAYTTYQEAKHIIAITATYGDGEAPTNAKRFNRLFSTIEPVNRLQFSVVGLGSLAYPEFCKFAEDIDEMFRRHSKFISSLSLEKINNKSTDDFKNWIQKWGVSVGVSLDTKTVIEDENWKRDVFKIIDKTYINTDNTFLLRLKPRDTSIDFRSGDLLAIRPEENMVERLYSIARIDGDVILSVKKHDLGVCSTYLSKVGKGDIIKAAIKHNVNFYFPSNTKDAILIANGTGIAPFLGMMKNKNRSTRVTLFWGVRTKKSIDIYNDFINFSLMKEGTRHIAYSRENNIYVQDLIRNETDSVINVLNRGGVVMICGSNDMLKGVISVLEKAVKNQLNVSLNTFIENEQIKIDCY
ncbi:sulfite reductase (NADPH) flavoprotein alpha-component [Aquimarina amphilecti]|uniref:NADPH--hemoprotein reductase n=1 Tax=Aquimarina amphilecti TaxID=1038014 RepID=A0A1H7PMW1_AQUAM|nr:PepSY domain-containing protein [Aquimarina amphilecti]SEL36595.1 sulfite reductase (NADPH) flavoprotein alpha-component [Aquimarina amphilecti]